MSLLQALLFPLRNPAVFLLVVLVHCIAWSMVVAGLNYSARSAGSLEATTVFVQCIAVPILYSIWLQRRAIASLRRLFAGGHSLPRLKISDFLPLRLRTLFSTLFMFSYLAICILVMQRLRADLWADLIAIDAFGVVEAVHMLARFAVILVALTLLTVLYIVGLSRYATEGEGRNAANRIADELGLLKNRRRSCHYLLVQLILLSGAAYLLELGIRLADATRPPIQSFAVEGGMAWQTFGMFAFACGLVLVWNASLHLLAQYARSIGIRRDDQGSTKAKGKRDFTQG